MTHRLDIRQLGSTLALEIQGLVDARALAGLRAFVRPAIAQGLGVRIVLRAGAEVDRSCIDELRALGGEVVAEDAYLARWLEETR